MTYDLDALIAHHLDQYRGLDDVGRYELRRYATEMTKLRDPRSAEIWRQFVAKLDALEAGES
jgi:hypothetical protein